MSNVDDAAEKHANSFSMRVKHQSNGYGPTAPDQHRVGAQTIGSAKDLKALLAASQRPRELSRQYERRSLNVQRSAETHLRQDYEIGKVLGMGGFCKVNLATHVLTGEQVAIKIVKLSDTLKDARHGETSINNLRAEHLAMARFDHPNIVALYETFATPQMMYISMEYAAGGDLTDYVLSQGHLEEGESAKLTHQLLSALQHVHAHGIVHRDVKPDNVLLDRQRNVKLGDFGLSAQWSSRVKLGGLDGLEWGGTPSYLAPEVIRSDPDVIIGPKVDVWGAGLVLYAMLTGELPFGADTEEHHHRDSTAADRLHHLLQSILEDSFAVPGYLSEDVRELLGVLLDKDPVERITVHQALRSDWIIERLPGMALPFAGSLRPGSREGSAHATPKVAYRGGGSSSPMEVAQAVAEAANEGSRWRERERLISPAPKRPSALEKRWLSAAVGTPGQEFAKSMTDQFSSRGGGGANSSMPLAERMQEAGQTHARLRRSMKQEHLDILQEAHAEAMDRCESRRLSLVAELGPMDMDEAAATRGVGGDGAVGESEGRSNGRASDHRSRTHGASRGPRTTLMSDPANVRSPEPKDRGPGGSDSDSLRFAAGEGSSRDGGAGDDDKAAPAVANSRNALHGPLPRRPDKDVVVVMQGLGFNKKLVERNVRAGAVNHVTMAYKILRAKSRRMSAHNFSMEEMGMAGMAGGAEMEAEAEPDTPNTIRRMAQLEQEQREREINETAAAMTDTLRRMSHSHNQHGIQKMQNAKNELLSPTRDSALAQSFMKLNVHSSPEMPAHSGHSSPASAPRLLMRSESGSESESENENSFFHL